jgi:hypothetical protein
MSPADRKSIIFEIHYRDHALDAHGLERGDGLLRLRPDDIGQGNCLFQPPVVIAWSADRQLQSAYNEFSLLRIGHF